MTRTATCNCGKVSITTIGEPVRVGICHCTICRKEGGSAFAAIAIWSAEAVSIEGETASWTAKTDARYFCPACGSTLFSVAPGSGEIELRLGAFDPVPTDLVPTYESWVVHREPWLPDVTGVQHGGDRT
jgi:hypothetical protein